MIDDRFLADNTALLRPPVHFYFDFSSPYSYVASEWIEAVAARHGRRVQWHAILLGVTFQAAELKSPVSHPIKRDYTLRDFERSARFAGLPYSQPETFPIATQNAARVFWWLHDQDPARAVAWAHAGLRAYFTRGVVLSDGDALKALLADSGIDAGAAEAAWSDPVWKARLKAENEAAVAAGVFGAPHFIVDGEPFWGNDRQAQIERWLASGPFKGMT
ncbi:2-hydroxychromene-2-carboxylate isomerase [Pelomonas saccharophila]|uniref:2-hydroxychromene-2-carboxylate isomerase n=1 Tax=Roseateles saccharophilus TaxID=304 RepID=A0ABU1YWG1_ROSSA|nr:2-hydroxychromene-2-carboxylate isomerase [Roseateles saccharophilus]MDR7273173.1 2-hydroxychromene-2-carboxylate isomerase [Roseateles saccharophilus]